MVSRQSLMLPRRAAACVFCAVMSLSLAVTACSRPQAQPEPASPRSGRRESLDVVPVVTATASVKNMPVLLQAVGTAEAISTVEIRAQVTGQLQDILFTPGDEVKRGQALFTLDARPFEAAIRQADAVLARDSAQASVAKTQASRLQSLFDRGLIARDQYEAQQAATVALEATLAADRAQIDQARLNLQYATIAAPIDGRSGALTAHAGDVVRANDTALVTITQVAPIDVTFAVPARLLSDIGRNQGREPLLVTAIGPAAGSADGVLPGGGPGAEASRASRPASVNAATEQGDVVFIDNAVDPTTATIRIKARFANSHRSLWPGLFVQVALELTSQPRAVVVPATAVQPSQQGPFVYLVTAENTAEMRPVTIDRQQGDEVVIASGLRGGEQVVVGGQLRLTPGAHVTVQAASGS